ATLRMRSRLATEVPPNFITTNDMRPAQALPGAGRTLDRGQMLTPRLGLARTHKARWLRMEAPPRASAAESGRRRRPGLKRQAAAKPSRRLCHALAPPEQALDIGKP